MAIPVSLIVVPVSNLAGVARHVLDLARVGVPGWRLVFCVPPGPLADGLRDAGVAVTTADISPETRTYKAVRVLRRAIQSVHPAVVHSHLARADILATLASVGLPVKLVSTEHHISPDPLMFHDSRLKAAVMQAVHHVRLRRFAALMAVSESTKRDMQQYWRPRQPVHVVRNGVDRPTESPARTAGLRLLSLARLSPEKNIEMTLRAFSIVHRDHPDGRLTIAGEGPSRGYLEQLAHDLGVAEAVSFPGFVDSVHAMNEHDVIVQPSKSDNLSYTLLDAVAAGLGVAASPVGGNPEILPDRCIADLTDESGFASIILDQGLNPSSRPTLPDCIPTVAHMADQVADVYAEAVG